MKTTLITKLIYEIYHIELIMCVFFFNIHPYIFNTFKTETTH